MMTRFEERLKQAAIEAVKELYQQDVSAALIQIQLTRKDLVGDFTLVVFALLIVSRKNPVDTGNELGHNLQSRLPEIERFEVIKGFLNFTLKGKYWLQFLDAVLGQKPYGFLYPKADDQPVLVEFSSPNTNKPLHLGHIRNNLLGFSVAKLLEAAGKKVVKVNLVNDRGIHICKSMLAWQKWGKGITPQQASIKGDRLVGDFYVRFEKAYQAEIKDLIDTHGMSKEEAAKQAPLLKEAQEMLRSWEAGNQDVQTLWERMNTWVYEGFDQTYRSLGISFDKTYYESQTYKLGRKLVLEGVEKDILIKKDDQSVWADLKDDGLDEKLLLRSDGTSVYMTQDLGTAHQRFAEYNFDSHVYVVGNEQNYHFKVLGIILKKLGFDWADGLIHLSYGMVELPEGKMKSREGKVVDADDLLDEMINNAQVVSDELGKLSGFTTEERKEIYYRIAMGALKYFILKVDPSKTMLFNPKESIDFNGNTGPFIQYTYVRIKSVLRKAKDQALSIPDKINQDLDLEPKEISLLKQMYTFDELLQDAANQYSPALIANYLYDLVKEFNQFYQEHSILNETDGEKKAFRLSLSAFIADHLRDGMGILGITMPERM